MTHINHINQVKDLIKDKPEFVLMDKGDYFAIDYNFETETTFENPLLIECRGIKFNKDGSLLARPLHKFKNLNQSTDYQIDNIDWNQSHVILTKLDGSMIHAAYINEQLVFMTRAGITDQSKQAYKECINVDLQQFCVYCEAHDITPIFEYTSPKNRIVVKYDEAKLTLLAMREKFSGNYIHYKKVKEFAKTFNLAVVNAISNKAEINEFVKYTKDLKEQEGFVIWFDSGFAVKIKSEDYVLKHKVKSFFDFEKSVLESVLTDKTDDLVSLLEPEQIEKLNAYKNAIDQVLLELANKMYPVLLKGQTMERKDFALGPVQEFDARLRGILFDMLKNKEIHIGDIVVRIKEYMLKWCSTQSTIDQNRDILRTEW